MKERKHIVQPGNRISLYIHKHSFIYLFKNIFVLCMHAIYLSLIIINEKTKISKYLRKINRTKEVQYEVTKQILQKNLEIAVKRKIILIAMLKEI